MSADALFDRATAEIIEQGACAFCNGPYAYHRLFDMLWGRFKNGESLESIAAEWKTDPAMMVAKWLAFRRLSGKKI
jgi:hypothetical protein